MTVTYRLVDFLARSDAWGTSQGRAVREKLAAAVDSRPDALIVRISLAGIRQTDASFARESVVELAHRYRGRRGFCVTDFESEDVLENWDAAALKRGQPIVAWTKAGPRLLGPQPRRDTWDLLRLVLQRGEIGTAEAAKVLRKQVTNVSTRLKRLSDEGLVVRREVTAPTGGLEYLYLAIQ